MLFRKKEPFATLKSCQELLHTSVLRYKKCLKSLAPSVQEEIELALRALEASINEKNLAQAKVQAEQVSTLLTLHCKKSAWDHTKEFVIAVLVALLIAAVVRQTWFELYEIPTGSMRPTFKESDRVLVSKDSFGINVPFQTRHFSFDPALVSRGQIVVITGDNLDLPDVDTVYFGLFPGKRRYVKRCVAKGEDRIYFYGGKIYGIDSRGNPIEEIDGIEHIPFISFEGKLDYDEENPRTITIRHMNIPVAKIEPAKGGIIVGEVITDNGEQKELDQFWGIKNYAQVRLLDPKELPGEARLFGYDSADAVLYLELKSNPELPSKTVQPKRGSLLQTSTSWLALDEAHVQKIIDTLYTSRFYIRNGRAYRYTPEGPDLHGKGVFVNEKIPDGCYEFYHGQAYNIGFGAHAEKLPKTHPIYPTNSKSVKTLFNAGIDWTTYSQGSSHFPSRYSYFRDGDLYVLGAPLFTKNEETVTNFIAKETKRAEANPRHKPFIDHGKPSEDEIRKYGLQIPKSHYLLFGDNHAMSNDSRFFGAVPEENLQGSPILLFWPPGCRWGEPPQPSVPFFRFSNMVVLFAVTSLSGIAYVYFKKRRTL